MATRRILITEWTTPEKLAVLKGWAISGLTREDIAKNIGISRSLLYEWQASNQDIAEALKLGAREADCRVVNALYEKALSGDTTAMIFWLKNRMSKQWREKQEITNTFTEDFEIKIGGKDAENNN
jgi:transcriptional regulator with XRE-family HTH domain